VVDAAVVETYVGMSRGGAIREKVGFSCCCGLFFDALGFSNLLHSLGRVGEVKGLALCTGLPIKVTMVMMTLSAFPRRGARRLSTGSFWVLRPVE